MLEVADAEARVADLLRSGGDSLAQLDDACQQYEYDPAGWITERLRVHLWSKQREIVEAVAKHRQVAVYSCVDSGKSYAAACLMAWWGSIDPENSFIVSTAPTFDQVRAILWRYLRQVHRKGGLVGNTNQTEWKLGGDLIGYGRKPAHHDISGFQGIHARRVLLLFDEAQGIPESLWTAGAGVVSNEHSRWVAFGNPDPGTEYGEFYQRCQPSSGWHTIHIDGYETPNFTGEDVPEDMAAGLLSPTWVEARKLDWGEKDPRYIAKVHGVWPKASDSEYQIIPAEWVALAQDRWRAQPRPSVPMTSAGLDPSRGGADETAIARLHGTWFDEMVTAPGYEMTDGRICASFVERVIPRGVPFGCDIEGIGSSPFDFLKEDGWNVIPIAAGSSAPKIKRKGKEVPVRDGSGQYEYGNLRSFMWFMAQAKLNPITGSDLALPPGEDLRRQFTAPRYKIKGNRLFVEEKEEIKKRIGRSPDDADAMIHALYVQNHAEKKTTQRIESVSKRRGRVRW